MEYGTKKRLSPRATSSKNKGLQPKEISTVKELSDLVAKGKAMVMFYAPWCGHCQEAKPVYIELSNKHPNILFLRVNADKYKSISKKYNVKYYPTYWYFINGSGDEIESPESVLK